MARANKAYEKMEQALDMMHRSGADPLNYMLSYVMGFMDAGDKTEYIHEFEKKKMTITLSDYRPKLTLVKGEADGENDVPAA